MRGASDSGQTFTGLTFTVGGLVDGASEQIAVDNTTIMLGGSSSGTTTVNGMGYAVTVSGGVATIVLTKAAGISTAAINTLVNGITYQDTNVNNPTVGSRTFTLIQIKDSGATNNTTTLSVASTVNVTAVNDAPVVTAGATVGFTEQGSAVVLDSGLTVSDADNTTLASATVSISAASSPATRSASPTRTASPAATTAAPAC